MGVVSWRVFSRNKGKPSQTNIYIDAEAIIEWITKEKLTK
jgi:hypothetical protein